MRLPRRSYFLLAWIGSILVLVIGTIASSLWNAPPRQPTWIQATLGETPVVLVFQEFRKKAGTYEILDSTIMVDPDPRFDSTRQGGWIRPSPKEFDTLQGPIVLREGPSGVFLVPRGAVVRYSPLDWVDQLRLRPLELWLSRPGESGSIDRNHPVMPMQGLDQVPRPMGMVTGFDEGPDSSRFRWLDSSAKFLQKPRLVPFRYPGHRLVLPARCGWLDCGIEIGTKPLRPSVRWCVVPGERDTFRLALSTESFQDIPFGSSKWHLPGGPRSMGDSWTLTDSGLSFLLERHHADRNLQFIPAMGSLRWVRGGRSWEPSGTFERTVSEIRSLSIPPRMHGVSEWVVHPAYVPAGASVVVPGTGRVEWSDRVRWISPDSLVAVATLVPDTSLRGILGSNPVSIEVPLEIRRGVPSDSAVPRMDRFRTRPNTSIVMDSLARITSNGVAFSLARFPDGFRLTSEGEAPAETRRWETVDPRHRGAGLFWMDAEGIREVAGIGGGSKPRLVFDTGTARILSRRGGITFAVDDVAPNSSLVPSREGTSSVSREFDGFVRRAGQDGPDPLIPGTEGENAFLFAFLTAWNEHRPLRLSPDAVWMALMGSLVDRVEQHPDSCRTAMVKHEGRKTLDVGLPESWLDQIQTPTAWNGVSRALLDNLHGSALGGRDTQLLATFSTTTPERALAMRMRVLELYAQYFEYRGFALCGIPSLTLEGTPADWRRIRERIHALSICGLEPWVARMDPILAEFVHSSEGRPSRNFWRSFVRYHAVPHKCGANPWLDGWITSFFPFDRKGALRSSIEILYTSEISVGRGSFDFTWTLPGGRSRKFKIVSGFSGVAQSRSDGSIHPELGWEAWEDTVRNRPAPKVGTEDGK